jgi:hypothetical protein
MVKIDWLQPDDKGIANGRSTQIAAAQPRPGRVTLECPERTVAKTGSGHSPGTLENEKLPLAIR